MKGTTQPGEIMLELKLWVNASILSYFSDLKNCRKKRENSSRVE
jgi:hypothetical protein